MITMHIIDAFAIIITVAAFPANFPESDLFPHLDEGELKTLEPQPPTAVEQKSLLVATDGRFKADLENTDLSATLEGSRVSRSPHKWLKKPESTGHQYNQQTQHSEPQVQYYTPQVQHYEPQVQHYKPQVQYYTPQVQYHEPQVQHYKPQVQYYTPQVQYHEPQVQHYKPQVQYKPQPQYDEPVKHYVIVYQYKPAHHHKRKGGKGHH